MALRATTTGEILGVYTRNITEAKRVKGLRSRLSPKENIDPEILESRGTPNYGNPPPYLAAPHPKLSRSDKLLDHPVSLQDSLPSLVFGVWASTMGCHRHRNSLHKEELREKSHG